MPVALFDTNILIDYLKGIKQAKNLFSKYDQKLISIITYIEVLSGASDEVEKRKIRAFISKNFEVLDLDTIISEEAINIRAESIANKNKLKLPDCIVLASANTQAAVLITRDINAFSEFPNVIVPYKV